MEQDKLKPVLEYLAKQCHEQQKSASTTAKPAQSKQTKEQKKGDRTGQRQNRNSPFRLIGRLQRKTNHLITQGDRRASAHLQEYRLSDTGQSEEVPQSAGNDSKRTKLVSARHFSDQLCRDGEQQRKIKKRNQLSGLHKSVDVDIRRSNVLLFAGI